MLQRQLQAALQELKAARQRIEELEKKAGGNGTAKVDEPFSMRAEEKRQQMYSTHSNSNPAQLRRPDIFRKPVRVRRNSSPLRRQLAANRLPYIAAGA
jgi:hypothetical protein